MEFEEEGVEEAAAKEDGEALGAILSDVDAKTVLAVVVLASASPPRPAFVFVLVFAREEGYDPSPSPVSVDDAPPPAAKRALFKTSSASGDACKHAICASICTSALGGVKANGFGGGFGVVSGSTSGLAEEELGG